MIEKLSDYRVYSWHTQHEVVEKINEMIEEINRLGKEPAPHRHIEHLDLGPISGSYDQFMEEFDESEKA